MAYAWPVAQSRLIYLSYNTSSFGKLCLLQDINGVFRGSSEPTETLSGTVTISRLAQVCSVT